MLIKNEEATRAPYSPELRGILSIDNADVSRQWLSTWSMLADGPTPLWQLPGLAQRLGLRRLVLKDESKRSPLSSFKILGAPFALVRLILREMSHLPLAPAGLLRGCHAAALRDFTVVSATDGNHGRALAAAAQAIGCRCVIVLHRNVSTEREEAIARYGAEIVRIEGDYDASVVAAAELAAKHSWFVVSDTSYEGYEAVPRDVMQGYGTIAAELLAQEGVGYKAISPYSHVILQGGVGGLAAGVVSYLCERFGEQRPVFIVVEPEQADCLLQSARLRKPARATGTVDSVMAGLACGETSPLAWRFLAPAVDFFLTVSDEEAVQAMRILAAGACGDIPVVSGESGAASLAGLMALCTNPDFRSKVFLTADSSIMLINTEGATAPSMYETLVGEPAVQVLRRQIRWQDNMKA